LHPEQIVTLFKTCKIQTQGNRLTLRRTVVAANLSQASDDGKFGHVSILALLSLLVQMLVLTHDHVFELKRAGVVVGLDDC